jgi:D-threo-aldose 1-dehydrogenase
MTTNAAHAPWPKRALGATGLPVHPLGLGTAELGDLPNFHYQVGEERALATARAIFDGPLNLVDTAAGYRESERRLGVVLHERGGLPGGFVLSTKVGCRVPDGVSAGDQARRSIERSLRLLGLERLQLVFVHDPEVVAFDQVMAPDGLVDALRRCREEGLIGHLGVAGGPVDLMIRYVETGAFAVVLSHNRYTLLNVAADRLWDVARRRGVATLNAAIYGGGILSKGPAVAPMYAYRQASPALLERARRLEAICARHDVPLAAAALQFSMRDPRIDSTIVGISRPERVAETVALAQHPTTDALWAELRAVTPDTQDVPGAAG